MWFNGKIKYSVQDEQGRQKTIREQFLIDGILYGEVETNLAKLVEGRVSDYEYDLTKASFDAVYDTFVDGDFYKVQIEEISEDGKGQPKTTIFTHLVVADSVPDAERRATDYIKTWLNPTTIIGADKTKILGVWHPHVADWLTDFASRMHDLSEKGNRSSDHNQTQLFDQDGNPKKYEQERDELAIDVQDSLTESELEDAMGNEHSPETY